VARYHEATEFAKKRASPEAAAVRVPALEGVVMAGDSGRINQNERKN